ncbi:hypothetical protein B0T18DRAFT_392947 [Schizothecium vesticola]|uniref:Hydrophobin n=1 Tax=Schizothecium vesticola TaxID=314040 RepID=A0AA40BTH6_9PEZI|nr:hypothetical protein B0T18DRAFT_392947 [Schizothecium vesticola]
MHPTTILALLSLAAPGLSAPTELSPGALVVARTPERPADYCKTTNQDAYCCDEGDILRNLLGLNIKCALSLGSPCGENANVYCCNAGQTKSTGLINLNILTGCSVVNLLG